MGSRTADGDAFRFRAGRLSLDFCSTLLWRHREPVEQLRRPNDLVRWLEEAGVAPCPAAATEEDLARARALREAVYRLVRSRLSGGPRRAAPGGDGGPGGAQDGLGPPLPAEDVATVNAAALRPVPAPRLTLDGRVERVSDDPLPAALSTLARDCVDLLTGALAGRLRECGAPDCAFLFVDTSRPGTRRWCAMNRCGNRQHVRDHRSRRDPDRG